MCYCCTNVVLEICKQIPIRNVIYCIDKRIAGVCSVERLVCTSGRMDGTCFSKKNRRVFSITVYAQKEGTRMIAVFKYLFDVTSRRHRLHYAGRWNSCCSWNYVEERDG